MSRRPKSYRHAPARGRVRAAPVPALRPELRGLLEAWDQGGGKALADALSRMDDREAEAGLRGLAQDAPRDALPALAELADSASQRLRLQAIAALGRMGTRAAGEALLKIRARDPQSESGALALAAARSLLARGIRLDLPEEPATPIAEQDLGLRFRQISETLPDGVGTRQLTLRMQDRYGVWHSLAGIWNDRAGLKECLFSPCSRREWEQMQDLYRFGAVRFVEISPGYARHQLARAFALNEQTGLALPEEAGRLKTWLEEGEPEAPSDPFALLEAFSDDQRRSMAALVRDVLEEAGLQSWAFEPADVVDLHDEWAKLTGDHAHHEHDPDGHCLHQAPPELLARAAEKGIDASLRAVLGDRMKEVAVKYELLDRRHEAVVAAAAAWQVEQPDATGDIPFFQVLAGRALEMLDEIIAEGKDPEELRYDPMAPPPDAD